MISGHEKANPQGDPRKHKAEKNLILILIWQICKRQGTLMKTKNERALGDDGNREDRRPGMIMETKARCGGGQRSSGDDTHGNDIAYGDDQGMLIEGHSLCCPGSWLPSTRPRHVEHPPFFSFPQCVLVLCSTAHGKRDALPEFALLMVV